MNIDSLLYNAEAAAREGQLWRAKEILQSGMRSGCYDATLFERLGVVLLAIGDRLEAGKYLFLSGRRESQYAEPIELFLKRFSKAAPLQLYAAFPRAARLPRREDYPSVVQSELARLRFPDQLPAPRSCRKPAVGHGTWMLAFGCLTVLRRRPLALRRRLDTITCSSIFTGCGSSARRSSAWGCAVEAALDLAHTLRHGHTKPALSFRYSPEPGAQRAAK